MSHAFIDPVRNRQCVLVVPPGGAVYPASGQPRIGVKHPGCGALADLALELDAFRCRACGWSGRISGAWAMDMIMEAAPALRDTQGQSNER